MVKPPIRLKLEDRGYPRRQWVAYLEKDGSQWIIFAPGEHMRSVMHTLRYTLKALGYA